MGQSESRNFISCADCRTGDNSRHRINNVKSTFHRVPLCCYQRRVVDDLKTFQVSELRETPAANRNVCVVQDPTADLAAHSYLHASSTVSSVDDPRCADDGERAAARENRCRSVENGRDQKVSHPQFS